MELSKEELELADNLGEGDPCSEGEDDRVPKYYAQYYTTKLKVNTFQIYHQNTKISHTGK
jgi:hypothetical protein